MDGRSTERDDLFGSDSGDEECSRGELPKKKEIAVKRRSSEAKKSENDEIMIVGEVLARKRNIFDRTDSANSYQSSSSKKRQRRASSTARPPQNSTAKEAIHEIARLQRLLSLEQEERAAAEDKAKGLEHSFQSLKNQREREAEELYNTKRRLVNAERALKKAHIGEVARKEERKSSIKMEVKKEEDAESGSGQFREENRALKERVASLTRRLSRSEQLLQQGRREGGGGAIAAVKKEHSVGSQTGGGIQDKAILDVARLRKERDALRKQLKDGKSTGALDAEKVERDLRSLRDEIECGNQSNLKLSNKLAEAEAAVTAADERAGALERETAAAREEAHVAATAARNAMEQLYAATAPPPFAAGAPAAAAAAADGLLRQENENLKATADQLRKERDYWRKESERKAREIMRYRERAQRGERSRPAN